MRLNDKKLNTLILRLLRESASEDGVHKLKYYAFDWDDNLMYMPTVIYLLDDKGNEIGMSTKDFAKYRSKIGEEPFQYEGKKIVGYAEDKYRDFGTEGDSKFLIDSLIAPVGPAWDDFVECINGGSIFSIITARGHNPETLKEACYDLILSGRDGLNMKSLVDSLRKYRDLFDMEDMEDIELIWEYLGLCKFHPVTFGQGSAANPEHLKKIAFRDFLNYCRELAKELHLRAIIKDKISNNFILDFQLGVSDDDPKNVEMFDTEFGDEPGVKVYSTQSGNKRKIN
jgi:hypothetical protein